MNYDYQQNFFDIYNEETNNIRNPVKFFDADNYRSKQSQISTENSLKWMQPDYAVPLKTCKKGNTVQSMNGKQEFSNNLWMPFDHEREFRPRLSLSPSSSPTIISSFALASSSPSSSSPSSSTASTVPSSASSSASLLQTKENQDSIHNLAEVHFLSIFLSDEHIKTGSYHRIVTLYN